MTTKPSWQELLILEPRLADLMAAAVSYPKSDSNFCAIEVYYGTPGAGDGFKFVVMRYLSDPTSGLKTMDTYNAATDYLYEALPDCQHEGECR